MIVSMQSPMGHWPIRKHEKMVGRASPPARRAAPAGKPVPPEERLEQFLMGLRLTRKA
jgi:hypothetical protein